MKITPSAYNFCRHKQDNEIHIENSVIGDNEIAVMFQDQSFSVDADELVDAINATKGEADSED